MHGFFIKRAVAKRLQTVGVPHFSVLCKLRIPWVKTDYTNKRRKTVEDRKQNVITMKITIYLNHKNHSIRFYS